MGARGSGRTGLYGVSGSQIDWSRDPNVRALAWFATLIGVLELIGAVGLLIPRTTRYAVLGLTVIMFGAAYTHLANHEGIQVLRPVIFLAVLWAI